MIEKFNVFMQILSPLSISLNVLFLMGYLMDRKKRSLTKYKKKLRQLVLEGNEIAAILLSRQFSLNLDDMEIYEAALKGHQPSLKYLSKEFWDLKDKIAPMK